MNYPLILRGNKSQEGERGAAKPVLALPMAELNMPAPVLHAAVLSEEMDSEFAVDVPTTPREPRKE